MRISDWSSDVCSSDLCRSLRQFQGRAGAALHPARAAELPRERRGHDRSSRPRSIGMIAVIFEAQPHPERGEAYLDAAQQLRPLLADIDVFISIERFGSLAAPGTMLSLSFWHIYHAVGQCSADRRYRKDLV